ncbi:acylneuraminate cytidylyltransferase family protein [Patescibacteria group bacterium]|nr:acylneuraminate cytidylyltransferase family protein [Patescibacteria group bacterium]
MILAVIPARSGSKSIKDKNIKPLAGRPLMAWSIKAGLACKQIDEVVVSTDSDKYAQLAKFYGAEALIRPKELASDASNSIFTSQHAVKEVEKSGEKVDIVIELEPTSPLRLLKDIEKCLDMIRKPNTDSVATVCAAEHNPYYVMGKISQAHYFEYPLIKPNRELHRRQDAPKVYRLNAAVYAIKRDVLMAGKVFTDKTRVVIMPEERSIHIDNKLEFKLAELLIKEGYVQFDF